MPESDPIQAAVEAAIASHHLLVYSKSYCGFSKRAKNLLKSIPNKREEMAVVELDLLPNDEGPRTQEYLWKKTGQRTVPNVFIGQRHIGGSDALAALHAQGKLEPLVQLGTTHWGVYAGMALVAAGGLAWAIRIWRGRQGAAAGGKAKL